MALGHVYIIQAPPKWTLNDSHTETAGKKIVGKKSDVMLTPPTVTSQTHLPVVKKPSTSIQRRDKNIIFHKCIHYFFLFTGWLKTHHNKYDYPQYPKTMMNAPV